MNSIQTDTCMYKFTIIDHAEPLIINLRKYITDQKSNEAYEYLIELSNNSAMIMVLTKHANKIIEQFTDSLLKTQVEHFFNETLIEKRQELFFA